MKQILSLIIGVACDFTLPTQAAEAARPNIVIILADDLGYGDVGCCGATKIKTPNIGRLAREGMRFTDAHSPESVCSPSRYGLLSGRYPWRLHRKGNAYHIQRDRMNIASMLKTQGYRSAAIGKLASGPERGLEPVAHHRPL